jgi:hypothetical protein
VPCNFSAAVSNRLASLPRLPTAAPRATGTATRRAASPLQSPNIPNCLPPSILLSRRSAEGFGYSDKENVCFACTEGCASCTENSCSYCKTGWAFADRTETACTKVRDGVRVG